MAFLTKLLTAVSMVFLAHGIYSAHEHTTLLSTHPHLRATLPSLPIDIILETLFSSLLLTVCIVQSAPGLRPIRWAEWAGRIEREAWDPAREDDDTSAKIAGTSASSTGKAKGAGNPYRVLEERTGFWDVRASRKEFADFIRDGSISGSLEQ